MLNLHPLESFYAEFPLDSLLDIPLTNQELSYIAMCIGFRVEQSDFQQRILYRGISKEENIEIRRSIVKILNFQKERDSTVRLQKVTKVEGIVLNANYGEVLLASLVEEVRKIARILGLPVLDNIFISGDDVDGYLDSVGQIVLRRSQTSSYSYLVGYSVR